MSTKETMSKLSKDEKKVASFLFENGRSPVEIVEKIAKARARIKFRKLDMEVHHFLMREFERQMYPIEVYGKLANVKQGERKDTK